MGKAKKTSKYPPQIPKYCWFQKLGEDFSRFIESFVVCINIIPKDRNPLLGNLANRAFSLVVHEVKMQVKVEAAAVRVADWDNCSKYIRPSPICKEYNERWNVYFYYVEIEGSAELKHLKSSDQHWPKSRRFDVQRKHD